MIKVKEMKEDALINVKVNKSFYLMSKELSFYLFSHMPENEEEKEKALKKIMEGEYKDFNELERAFYTVTLLLAEIESQAKQNDLYEEKEILEPGDKEYIAPTE